MKHLVSVASDITEARTLAVSRGLAVTTLPEMVQGRYLVHVVGSLDSLAAWMAHDVEADILARVPDAERSTYWVERFDTVERGWFHVSRWDTRGAALEALDAHRGGMAEYRVIEVLSSVSPVVATTTQEG